MAKKFKPGDKWSEDFDYDGMLKYGKKVDGKTSDKQIEKYGGSMEDVNYHTLAKPLFDYQVATSGDKEEIKKYFLRNFKRQLSDELQSQGEERLSFDEIYKFKKGGSVDEKLIFNISDGIYWTVVEELGIEVAEAAMNLRGYHDGYRRGWAAGVNLAQCWQQQSPHCFQQSQPQPWQSQQHQYQHQQQPYQVASAEVGAGAGAERTTMLASGAAVVEPAALGGAEQGMRAAASMSPQEIDLRDGGDSPEIFVGNIQISGPAVKL